MGSFTEIELDLSYLDDLEEIIVHDECGGDDVSFYREGLLASDNAKLRELCANLWVVAKSGSCVDRCKLYDTCMPNYDENGCMLKRQLGEFGIGVSK